MRPSAKQLIDGIDWSLQHRVVPVTDDKWAASTLRSVHCLLQHLSVRVEAEGALLHEDNADLRRVLGDVRGALEPTGRCDEACTDLDAVLARRWREDGDFPTVASMTEENDALRAAVDALLGSLHEPARADPEGVEVAALAMLDGYLQRRLQREQPLFVPAFLASTF